MDEPGMGEDMNDEDMHEAAQRWHNKKSKKGPKTSRMSIVPDDPAARNAAPFPSPMGNRQKRK
jgi:hypothetical protein